MPAHDTPSPEEARLDIRDHVANSYEQKVEHACHLLLANPLNRPLLYRTLKAAATQTWTLHELESYIQSCPEFTSATQPPYFIIKWLADADALGILEMDAQGSVIEPARLEGLSEDEMDDLIDDYSFAINDVGRDVLVAMEPKHRLMELMHIIPERYDTYKEVLEFLSEKRPYSDVDKLLRGREILMSGREPGDHPMQPSVFIDKLSAAGGIVWDDGWQISKEGKELLEVINEIAR
jgi:hypothetical protein